MDEVGALIAKLASRAPSAGTITALASIDRTRLSAEDAIMCLQTHAKAVAWMASMEAELLVAAAASEPVIENYEVLLPDSGEEREILIADIIREEVAAAMRWSPATAQARIDTARLLTTTLPQTKDALSLGDISASHVAAMVEEIRRLPGHHGNSDEENRQFALACAQFERLVLPTARRSALSRTRAASRCAILRIDADGVARRRARARCTRDVWVMDELDGHATFGARLLTERAHALLTAINQRAASLPTEPGALAGERRVQALVELVCAGASGTGGDGSGVRSSVHVDVVMSMDTLLGMDDAPVELRGADRGGEPLTAYAVRELLADPQIAVTMRWRRVTDPMTGTVLDVGRRSYQVPDRLRELIQVRDKVCRFPCCERRASRCQIDHAQPWDGGGPTGRDNLGSLCVRHHQLKTHSGWQIVDSAVDGSCVWISAHGRRYIHQPQPALP